MGRRRSQPRGHVPADLVEAAAAGVDSVDGTEGDTAAKGCRDGYCGVKITHGPRFDRLNWNPEMYFWNMEEKNRRYRLDLASPEFGGRCRCPCRGQQRCAHTAIAIVVSLPQDRSFRTVVYPCRSL